MNKLNLTSAWPFTLTLNGMGFSKVPQDNQETSDVRITHLIAPSGKGGVTMAWRKVSDTKNARMVEVAVAYCSPSDVFTKKIGKQWALENFDAGMTVLVPARTGKSDDSIPANLRSMFWYSLGLGNW